MSIVVGRWMRKRPNRVLPAAIFPSRHDHEPILTNFTKRARRRFGAMKDFKSKTVGGRLKLFGQDNCDRR